MANIDSTDSYNDNSKLIRFDSKEEEEIKIKTYSISVRKRKREISYP